MKVAGVAAVKKWQRLPVEPNFPYSKNPSNLLKL